MIRVFVGIKISVALKQVIEKWKEKYKTLPLRWIEEYNLHVTLVPPWYVEPADIEHISNVLEGVQQQKSSFYLSLTHISYGPEVKYPRFIWVTGQPREQILELRKDLFSALHQKEEKRFFTPHITVAKFTSEPLALGPLINIDEEIHWGEYVDNFTLFESKLLKTGAQYKVLKEFVLSPGF